MEMPVPCSKCGKWVELNDTRESELNRGEMLCRECASSDYLVKQKIEEIQDIQYMLDNNDPDVRGDRRGWKRNIKDLKKEIEDLGYDYSDYEY